MIELLRIMWRDTPRFDRLFFAAFLLATVSLCASAGIVW